MSASFFVNAMQVDFASVLAMEHTWMVRMFKTLEDTGFKGFMAASSSTNKEEMKMEYRLLHDVVAKALCAKAGTFDMVTSEKYDLMVEISASLKVNWAQVLFQVLVAKVNSPNRQSQGFAVQLSVFLEHLVKVDLGESVMLHTQKVLKNKSVHTYIKKNLNVVPAGETSKASGATASEQHSTADGPQSLPKEQEKAAVEKPKKKKEKVTKMVKKQKVAVQQPVEARSQAAQTKSQSETISDGDSCPLARLKKGGAKQNEMETGTDNREVSMEARHESDQPAQKYTTYTGKSVYAPIEIREINWDIRERAECQIQVFNQWRRFHTGYRLSKIPYMKFVEEFAKTENKLFSWAEMEKVGAWLQPESQGDWLFTVGGGRFVQSSPRPEARFLRQPALEGLTRSARTETPQNGDRNKSDQRAAAAGGGAWAAAGGFGGEGRPRESSRV
ncbi:hypothetical protein F511_20806 [Dorcoceras hygrometricum]|uniref:Uncharacterized protein n=1 Tax=Dorcoceras hygrometricum TaxID=472368 RepID=A0A2Z7B827_9LAMI|nr:hypothetical protein F511_20806 [Dorcoceras hygrometricum]